jgi:hypothetical protein
MMFTPPTSDFQALSLTEVSATFAPSYLWCKDHLPC